MSDAPIEAAHLPVRTAVEVLLLEHPDVAAASLVNEEGPDGRIYPVAYVVPHVEHMNEAKTRVRFANREKRVAQWKKAFDQVYRLVPSNHAPTFAGWTSSYTNNALPETEMREWLDCTVERIMSLKPEKVLEIGCGVGLLVQELAPKCTAYSGIDISPIALNGLREFVATKHELRHVKLTEGEAANLGDHEPGSVDTVLINSVVQYFPDISYLRAVLDGVTKVVSSGGRIFIGDVRHLGLLPMFHSAVQLAKAPPKATARWLKRKVILAVEQERELVIDPQFFLDLPALIPRVCGVDILTKRGQAHNELTRYRYDVVLHVGETALPQSQPAAEWQSADQSAAELMTRFDAQSQLTSVTIADVPNRRLASDIASMRRLWSADDRHLVENIRMPATIETGPGLDPEDFWKFSQSETRDVRVDWSPRSAEGHFDVLLAARDRSLKPPSLRRATSVVSSSPKSHPATDPSEATVMQQLALELQQRLHDQIPAAQLPLAVLVVKNLPSSEPAICPSSAVCPDPADGRRTAPHQTVRSSSK